MEYALVHSIDLAARRQYGLLSREQALARLGRQRLDRWTAQGRLELVQPRVFRLAGTPRDHHQALMAASLSAHGPVSHRSAAWLWGLHDRPEEVEVSVRYPRRASLRPPATAHRIRDLTEACCVQRSGLLVTDPMRTLVDLGLVVRWEEVDAALGRALSSRLLPLRAVIDVRERLARRGRNGTGVIQRVFDERLLRGASEESTLELRLLRITRRFGLPLPVVQHELWHDGRFVARIDACYPDRMVAIEADGFAWHGSPEAFQADRERQNELVRLGWTVLRFTHHDVVRRHRHVADVISSVL